MHELAGVVSLESCLLNSQQNDECIVHVLAETSHRDAVVSSTVGRMTSACAICIRQSRERGALWLRARGTVAPIQSSAFMSQGQVRC